MNLPGGDYCVIRSKHVCAMRDKAAVVPVVHEDGSVTLETPPGGPFCDVPAPLNPGDHHWVTLLAQYWHSEADFKTGKPPVLTTDPQFGHRWILTPGRNVAAEIADVLDSHYAGGRRGVRLDPARHPSKAVDDVLGLLKHPHVAAIEVTP